MKPSSARQPIQVFISHSHDDNDACKPLLAALTAWGVDYWFDTERLDAGGNLSTRIQAAIAERAIFLRVCSVAVQQHPYWVNLETDAFRALQARDANAGLPATRTLIPFILDTNYTLQPFELAVIYIDAARKPLAVWVAALRRALQLETAPLVPYRVVDWRRGADHTTIGAAIAAAEPGERILIRPGVYTESLVIDKPLELVGDGERDDILIEARDASVLTLKALNGRVAHLTLRQLGGDYYCVNIPQGAMVLEDCDISSLGYTSVCIHGASARPRVRLNRIHDGEGAGVVVKEQGQGIIEYNDIFDNGSPGKARSGISIREGAVPTVRRNRIYHNTGSAIHVYDKGGGIFEDNDLRDNQGGAWAITADSMPPVTRRNNQE